jgi:hypothetical protein
MTEGLAFEPDEDAGRDPVLTDGDDGYWACIAFVGHNEYTGHVTEIVKNGQPAYHVDLPEKLWGVNPLAYVEYAATAWFSEHPVTEESVRKAWEARLRAAEERKRREDEWDRLQQRHALTDGSSGFGHELGEGDYGDEDDDDD